MRGWSQRITPTVRVPASSSETANPRRRAKLPPVVTGRTTGVPVSSLNGAGENDHDRPGSPLFVTGRGIEADEPDVAPLHYNSSLPTGPGVEPCPILVVGRRGLVALCQQVVERVARVRVLGATIRRPSSTPISTLAPARSFRRSRSTGGTASMTRAADLAQVRVCACTPPISY